MARALTASAVRAPQSSPARPFLIVGVGASAGGLKALSHLLAEIPTGSGMAFVVIQHLDPLHDSQLPALLSQSSRLPVAPAVDGCELQPDHVYVIMPNTVLRIADGRLLSVPRVQDHRPNLCIDAFFRALAAERPGSAIGILLSGSDNDGTLGLAAIKAAGGVTFAQDDTAEYPAMPRRAIDQGHVDFVLAPAEIARELAKIAEFGFPPLPPATEVPGAEAGEVPASAAGADEPAEYAAIIRRLRSATGIDFTHYRAATITRRTRRRMALVSITTLAEYDRFLTEVPEEIDALARDILINVTSFYRDQAVFEALKAVMFPALLRDRSVDAPIRIWIVGCSTGQEVYSLAIELMELLRAAPPGPLVQIFATDISDWALAKARLGTYPESIASEIPPDRLARYFTREGPGYRVVKEIRDLCVFAKHDVTSDTPFSRIDLISCRNVLIYLGLALQRYVLPTFHFSLKPGGFLLLGTAETTGRSADLFAAVDEKTHLYRAIPSANRARPLPVPHLRAQDRAVAQPAPPPAPTSSDVQRAADQVVLGRFAPAGVLVTDTLEIIQFRGHTNPYLEPAPGEASLNLLSMVPFAVAEALVGTLSEAKRLDVPVRRERITHRRAEAFREIALEVIPIKLPASTTCFLVLFEEQGPPTSRAAEDPSAAPQALTDPSRRQADSRELAQLRAELAAATDYNRSLVELNHGLVEQLKESQEEAQSSSEEYRSTNEELQTTKEEVESTNEELVTINDALRATNGELAKASAAVRESGELTAAIVETMRYPLLVLTADLNVESANQAFLAAFGMKREETIGRLVYDLGDGRWDIPELRRLLQELLPGKAACDDFEVTHDFGRMGLRTMLLNARRLQGAGEGARLIVLVIADITHQARITKDLKEVAKEQLRSNVELDQFAAVVSHDLQEPLRMMASFISLLGSRYGALFDARAREYMSHVTSGAQRMAHMINAILTYSRIGHETADATWIESGFAFDAARENLKIAIEEAQATITVTVLPCLKASREQLTQLFQNLLGNALKFRSGERQSVIRVTSTESADAWSFAISDNGIGMEPADLLRIFQPFQRLSTTQLTAGYGIGLATCAKIVDHHKGRIWADSTLGAGTTFTFMLPK